MIYGTSSKQLALVTEDDQIVLTILSVTAQNGYQAIELAKQETPCMILMDLYMPELDGFSAIRLIRSEEELKSVPIVAVTGFLDKEMEEAAYEAGCNYYLRKPIRLNELKAVVEKCWQETGQESYQEF
jgi:two-component system, cell cycle response regulator DivK